MKTSVAFCIAGAAVAADTVNVKLTKIVTFPNRIPENFVGFSVEVGTAPALLSFNGAPRTSYVNALRTIARGAKKGPNIRIGGNSADESVYLPSGNLPPNDTYRITAADLQAYAAAVPLWGGDIVIDTTLRDQNDPTLAVAHIQAVSGIVGWDLVSGVEIGNEVDLFMENGIRTSSYKYSDYAADFTRYASAISSGTNITAPRFQGATFCCGHFDSNLDSYIDTFKSQLATFSYHNYPLNHCNGHVNELPQLLQDSASYGFAARMAGYVSHALSAGVPFVVGEGNSVACGGQYGISDVFASALWAVDTLFAVASVGISRWNYHGGTLGAYSPIWYNSSAADVPDVRPLFYGMWAFANATARNPLMYNTSVSTTNPFVKAWFVVDENGAGTVVVIHKDPSATEAAAVSIVPVSPLTQAATLTRVQAASGGVNATHGITFAGFTFDGSQDGLPLGSYAAESVPSVGGAFSFSLPPASIAVLALPSA